MTNKEKIEIWNSEAEVEGGVGGVVAALAEVEAGAVVAGDWFIID